ncbi:cysteine--tRNA ligase [Micrococcales bacterium 31B]|nr:cysteine--tRNA ligase [Micrococcales bacterium 31B]
MSIRIYDSASREMRDFVPQREGKVGMYVCGATPYATGHVGHLRTAVAFDVIARWFARSGYEVTMVRNVTDIDDKILQRAPAERLEWWALSLKYEREFSAAYRRLGCLEPTYEPRATGHVTEMAAFMRRLIERGHAYAVDEGDGNGSVYFDVKSFAEYGSLTRQKLDDMLDSGEEPAQGKRDPRDFALWKGAKADEPATASWETPYGKGRPGWHLECSAMAHRYLGETFDIHGGGLDLRFPHHENEQAQSRAAGFGFAQTWVHAGLLTVEGTKMGKSLDNFVTADQAFDQAAPVVVRLALSSGSYRSNVDYSADSLVEATAVWRRLKGFAEAARQFVAESGDAAALEIYGADFDPQRTDLPGAFVDAMNDDFNVPVALATVHETVTAGNTALAAGQPIAVATALAHVRGMLDTLGLDPLGAQWAEAEGGDAASGALDALLATVLEQRAEARTSKNWAESDRIRNLLDAAGIDVKDTPQGARWSLKGA